MSVTEPKIEKRAAQPSVGIRLKAKPEELGNVIPQTHDELAQWMAKHNIQPSGAPFVRYHVINMAEQLDIEMGFPVASEVTGDERVTASTIPAGEYAFVLYTGDYDGLMEANRVLVDWAKDNGVKWDNWDTGDGGDAFRSRFENYFTDPADEPDPAKWETEVTIKLADK